MRKFFYIRKIFKPPFKSMVSVNDFSFYVQYDNSIPELSENIKLFHKYIIFQPEKVGNFLKMYQNVVKKGEFMNGFKKIGEKIKYYREKRGLSQKMLAKRTFMTQSRLEEIENGQVIYQLWTLQKIARALDIDLPELLNFE